MISPDQPRETAVVDDFLELGIILSEDLILGNIDHSEARSLDASLVQAQTKSAQKSSSLKTTIAGLRESISTGLNRLIDNAESVEKEKRVEAHREIIEVDKGVILSGKISVQFERKDTDEVVYGNRTKETVLLVKSAKGELRVELKQSHRSVVDISFNANNSEHRVDTTFSVRGYTLEDLSVAASRLNWLDKTLKKIIVLKEKQTPKVTN
ncbi:MAG: hypothetical protein R3A13_04390 [Bdellovibrionota bacterium]